MSLVPLSEASELLIRDNLAPPSFDMAVELDATPPSIRLTWAGITKTFVVTYAPLATPKRLEAAIIDASRLAAATPNRFPMILAPYLSDAAMDRLQAAEVSGMDLSGNYLIVVPAEWFVRRSGAPNRFKSNQGIRNVYSGTSALVGRVLLGQHEFKAVTDIRERILARGGSISLPTVSKVLATLEEELVVRRDEVIRLIQPERLLDELVARYDGPRDARRLVGKAVVDERFTGALLRAARSAGVQVVGRSESLFVVSPTGGERTRFYVTSIGKWLADVPFVESDRFANVEFVVTREPGAYFDPETANGFPWCSRLQVYLELSKGGKREREAANQLRGELLQAGSISTGPTTQGTFVPRGFRP